MVYCTKCGTQNPDTALNCANCDVPIYNAETRPYTHHEYKRYRQEHHRRGSGIGLLIAGLFIVLLGFSALFGWAYGAMYGLLFSS